MKILFVFSVENKTSLSNDVPALTEDGEPRGGRGGAAHPVGGCADVGSLVLAGHGGQHEAGGVIHCLPVTQESSSLELASDQSEI